jgi:multiple RNA-binding domain-containing protein 1
MLQYHVAFQHGVDLASFDAGKGRSQTTLLIKNLPHETRTATIRSLITPYGVPERLLVTPSGTLALVELANADEASKAFKGLSYSRLGTSILYLEKAPLGVWQAEGARSDMYDEENADAKPSASGPDASASGQHASIPSSNDVSLFIKNFPFETTSQALREAFQHLPGYQSASVASGQGDRARQTRSAGYGFVYFDTDRSAELARIAMDGSLLGDRPIQVTHARRQTSDTLDGDTNGGGGSAAPSIGTARLIIKNLPFETSRKDLQQLLR